jgi:hypothetical protein
MATVSALARLWRKIGRVGRVGRWSAGGVVALVAVIFAGSFLVDEPLRRHLEHDMNHGLKGYHVRLGKLDFHPVGLSLDLEDLVVIQDANPDPPVAAIPRLHAGVQWSQILRGSLVANFEIDRPRVFVNRANFVTEMEDDTPIDQRGWQEAVLAIYPLRINRLDIRDGAFTYLDQGETRPLALTGINLRAGNIRNVRSGTGIYPSDIHLDATVFQKGRLRIDGNANFLSEPYAGVKAKLSLEEITLVAFAPILQRVNLTVREGLLGASGEVEYSPAVQTVELTEATINGLNADYFLRPHTAAIERAKVAVGKGVRAAKVVIEDPAVRVKIGALKVVNSNLGFVNAGEKPEYRVFLSEAALTLKNITNQRNEGIGEVRLSGKFMGSGVTKLLANLRPENKGPDFDVTVSIEDTDMLTMNDIFRAHGGLDVAAGSFSFFSELRVKEGGIGGYVKPLFRYVTVYDKQKDHKKPVIKQLYERLVGVAAQTLQNVPRHEVGAVVELKGRLDDPKVSVWAAIVGLVKNAFVKAVLPGFETEAPKPRA